MERYWVCYFWLGVFSDTQPCTNLPKLATSAFGWSGGMVRVKIAQDERLINFLGSKSVFKLSTKI